MITQEHLSVSEYSLPYNRQDWQQGYQSQPNEYNYWIDDFEGEIPTDLHGTLFRNGPGLLDINGQYFHHPFDGDGMICAISFDQGKAHFCNRFVRTEGFLAEQQAQTILYRGVFGTQKPGGLLANIFDLRLKNIANTNIIYWGGKLLALWEAAEPYRLDPKTLETLGKDYLDGVLAEGEAFGAHPWIDPSCELDGGAPCLVNFAIKPGLSTKITIYEFDPVGKLLRSRARIIPGFAFIHDFAITPNYCIFFQNPVSFNPFPFALGMRGAGECLKFMPGRPTRIVLIPRHGQQPMQILETSSGFVFHHANAFEQDGKIYVDSICYDKLPEVEANSDFREVNFEALSPGKLWRFSIDQKANSGISQVQSQLLSEQCCEFPHIHPEYVGRPYRYLFIGAAHNRTGNAPLQAILKRDMVTSESQLWSAAPKGYVSEPVFVPQPGGLQEDDGWVLTMVYDAQHHRSELVILDAGDLSRGPIARLHLKHHIPYGLHGSWSNSVF
ncbi:MAG: carotenoid oxygenase family protein [Symploca sp. SIO2E9]|nr:carotenoid oxygenase family protein [Symploca sp. SIO2E9]